MKVAYVIGRFQPFHNGHKAMLDRALEIADKVVVIIGDTGCKPTFKDPWKVYERKSMIQACYGMTELERMTFLSVEDDPYNNEAWVNKVHAAINRSNADIDSMPWERFLVGFGKDASSFYLKLFPEWQFVEVAPVMVGTTAIDATKIRESYFGHTGEACAWKCHVPAEVKEHLHDFIKNDVEHFNHIRDEFRAIQRFNQEWDCEASRKWGLTQIAVDTLLYDENSVLLIRRNGGVGKGSLALPGGFVDRGERLVDAALRELHEETGIKIKKDSLLERIFLLPFDHPGRSMRGRIVSNVLPIFAPDHCMIKPQPIAGDDAAEAMWVDRSDLPKLRREFFADHYHIIKSIIWIKEST